MWRAIWHGRLLAYPYRVSPTVVAQVAHPATAMALSRKVQEEEEEVEEEEFVFNDTIEGPRAPAVN